MILRIVLGTTLCWAGFTMTHDAAAQERSTNDSDKALQHTMKSLAGKDVALSDYLGDVVLIVNVASQCGLTPQYAGLQQLHATYGEKGLRVLGFPCNQFGQQEPGSAKDIQQFCDSNYGVSFPMFAKIKVNGQDACELYQFLTSSDTKPVGKGDIRWNFEKFLIGRDGQVVARFAPRTSPDDTELVDAIKAQLAQPKPAS